jgi:type IV pilus assembly protein PilC
MLFARLKAQEKINFARHLAMVVRAGLPLLEGLRMLRKQKFSKTLTKVIDVVVEDINAGKFLADSLGRFPQLFGDFFTNIVRVGETSGTLADNLSYLAEEIKKSKELQSKVRSALIYPIVLLVATIAVVSFLTFFVFPKILPVLSGFNVELPLTTRILIGFLEFTRAYGLYAVLGTAGLAVAARLVFSRVRVLRKGLHRLLLALPVLGHLMVNVNVANFSRVLGLLLKSGVHIVEGITITSSTFTNLVYRDIILGAADAIRRGETLGTYLEKHPKQFPPLMSGIVTIGEGTGNLEDNLIYLSGHYTEETEEALKTLTSLLEPILLIGMGLLVGFVALSIILPIYSLSQGIG